MFRARVRLELEKEIRAIADAVRGHDEDFAVPLLAAVVDAIADYFAGGKESTLIWHLKRFRNEAQMHDAQEAGECA